MGGTLTKVDIGHERGWLAPAAAASLARIDAQLGRLADVNEAGRSPEQADANYARWLSYLAGGPWAPYALPAAQSVHCIGEAVDSDDWYDAAAAAVWRDNGWRQTALYPNNPKKNEPWHGEYFIEHDNHRGESAAGGTPPRTRRKAMIPLLATSNGRDIFKVDPNTWTKVAVSGPEMDLYREIAGKLDPQGRAGHIAINDYIATGIKTSAIPTAPKK